MSLYVLDTDQGMITGLALLDVQGSKLDQVGQCLGSPDLRRKRQGIPELATWEDSSISLPKSFVDRP